jgi:hypothetical protein
MADVDVAGERCSPIRGADVAGGEPKPRQGVSPRPRAEVGSVEGRNPVPVQRRAYSTVKRTGAVHRPDRRASPLLAGLRPSCRPQRLRTYERCTGAGRVRAFGWAGAVAGVRACA